MDMCVAMTDDSSAWDRIKKVLHPIRSDKPTFDMLRHYQSVLEVRLQTIDEASLSACQKSCHAQVTEILKGLIQTPVTDEGAVWNDTYKAERLIALILSGEQLRQEIAARLQDIEAEGLKVAETLRGTYENLLKAPENGSAMNEAISRGILLQILERLHGNAAEQIIAGKLRTGATKVILACLGISFLLWIGPFILMNITGPDVGAWWSLFPIYWLAISGLLGAFFSRLLTIQRLWSRMTLEEVKLQRQLSYTLLRAGFGLCGALMVIVFIRSGVISGPLLPDFMKVDVEFIDSSGPNHLPISFVLPSKDLALLVVLCFLAGFSEALVPSMLARTETQFGSGESARGQ
jgi:hypothetical protein